MVTELALMFHGPEVLIWFLSIFGILAAPFAVLRFVAGSVPGRRENHNTLNIFDSNSESNIRGNKTKEDAEIEK